METGIENDLIIEIAGKFQRLPSQVNLLSESDAEILDWKNKKTDYLVLKTDGIFEEISQKLYEDPWLIGWMAITVTISDIAAVAADPIGILLSLQIPRPYDAGWLQAFQKGINDACSTYGVYVIGGDTNFTASLSVSSTAVATITDAKPLFRKKMMPGDLLYSTATLGIGNAFAYSRYFDPSIQITYRPIARLKESKLVQQYATACIDTSDGLFPAISVLADINDVGIELITPLRDILHKDAARTCQMADIPAWMMLAGPHGEYELLFSIPAPKKEAFQKACAAAGCQPVYLGNVITDKVVSFFSEPVIIRCSPSLIANLFHLSSGNIPLYFNLLMQQHKNWHEQ